VGAFSIEGRRGLSNASLCVSVIIPVLNEEGAIGKVIEEIPKDWVNHVIVVDNGSSDRTVEVARAAGGTVVHETIRGYGRAVQRGLKELPPECDTVVVLDGDHSDFPEELPILLDPVIKNEADMVIGSRIHAALPGSLTPQQRLGNWLTCLFIRFLYKQCFTDLGPFRAIRRTTLESMKMVDSSFGWNVEMHIKALKMGYRVVEVPVRYRPRIGKSKISGTLKGSLKAGATILWSLYRYGIRNGSH